MTWRPLFPCLVLWLSMLAGPSASAQRPRGQSTERQRQEQIDKKKERERQQEKAFREGRKDHWKKQDRSTRKRWRAQRRAAKRMRRGSGPDSWYKGMFRSGKPIPWTRRTANKVGNLFKRKGQRRSY